MLPVPYRIMRHRRDSPVVGEGMVDWSDPEFQKSLIISIVGLSAGIWWISGRIRAKLAEVEERRARGWHETDEISDE